MPHPPRLIHAFAGTLPHFSNYLIPIWNALPDDIKGGFHAVGRAALPVAEAGISPLPRVPKSNVVMVASYAEYRRCAPAPVIFVNHGAGQSYNGDSQGMGHSSYTGGKNRERTVLNLCPRESDAVICREGGADAVAIGPPPYLDPFIGKSHPSHPRPVIAISFHSDTHTCSESRWAYPHYQPSLANLICDLSPMYDFIGHCHPRMLVHMRMAWGRLNVPLYEKWTDVLDRADLYVCDISSTLYEFAATGRPVVVLDAPWYRTNVQHGLRFWSHADIGVRIQEPEQLPAAIGLALADVPPIRKRREKLVSDVYAGPNGRSLIDGRSTERAVDAICRLILDSRMQPMNS